MATIAGSTTVGLARVTGAGQAGHALATRLKVEAALASADLSPPGLPPAAVLIVNRLELPGRRPLPLGTGGRVDFAWERAARAAMADLFRQARRPLDQTTPAGCPAVLFRDEAELLACLALDVSLGRAHERWWWRAYLRRWGRLTPDIVAMLLAESPRDTPAALRLLAERGVAHNVLQRLTPAEARQVLQAICVAFDAPQLAQAAGATGRLPQHTASTAVPVQSREPGRIAPSWQSFLPPQTRLRDLAPHNAYLLGVSLALAQAPAVARSAAFVQAVERWWREQAVPHSGDVRSVAHRTEEAVVMPSDAPDAVASASPATIPVSTPPVELSSLAPATASASPQIPQDGPQAVQRDPAEQDIADQTQHPPNAVIAPAEALDGVVTELGGVLFLLNVMQRLDLPACFEPDWRLASRVGPWGVLELLGRGLLASELPTFGKVGNSDADPLWLALAAMDGREPGQLPGGALRAPDRVHVPAGWLAWLAADPVAASKVADEAMARWQAEIASPGFAMTDGLLAGIGHGARCWLAGVVPLLRRMLEQALGGEDEVAVALLRRGQLYVTSSHVDLILPLDSVSLAERRAGLDFDPGWLPDFGRVVQFHYR